MREPVGVQIFLKVADVERNLNVARANEVYRHALFDVQFFFLFESRDLILDRLFLAFLVIRADFTPGQRAFLRGDGLKLFLFVEDVLLGLWLGALFRVHQRLEPSVAYRERRADRFLRCLFKFATSPQHADY